MLTLSLAQVIVIRIPLKNIKTINLWRGKYVKLSLRDYWLRFHENFFYILTIKNILEHVSIVHING